MKRTGPLSRRARQFHPTIAQHLEHIETMTQRHSHPRTVTTMARHTILNPAQARAQLATRLLRTINRFVFARLPTKAMEARARAARVMLERRFPEHWGTARARAAHALSVSITFNMGLLRGTGPQSTARRSS